MSEQQHPRSRRALIAGAAVLGVGLAAGAPVQAASWSPKLEAEDDWMDLPGVHRMMFDCMSFEGTGAALGFADTYYRTNKSGYGLEPANLAMVLILRHHATPFGYNDAIWAKYGALIGDTLKLVDPATKKAPLRNLRLLQDAGSPPGRGVTLSDLRARGAHFAVCGAATQAITEALAKATKGAPEAIHAELVANLIPNGHLVASGIVALNRTQERGYAVAFVA